MVESEGSTTAGGAPFCFFGRLRMIGLLSRPGCYRCSLRLSTQLPILGGKASWPLAIGIFAASRTADRLTFNVSDHFASFGSMVPRRLVATHDAKHSFAGYGDMYSGLASIYFTLLGA